MLLLNDIKSQQRCFTAARRAQYGDELTFANCQVDVVEHRFVAKRMRHLFDADDVVGFLHG